MARRHDAGDFIWPALSLEGNLIAPAMMAKIDRREASEQGEADYGVRKGLTLREDISLAFRVGQAHFDEFAGLEAPSMDATRRFVRALLTEAFGFHDIAVGAGAVACMGGGGRVPVVVVPPAEALDRRSPTLSTDRARSPAFALQDYLNEHDEALWGLATNGTHLRLLRDNASLTRPAHLEADLGQIFAHEDAASFAVALAAGASVPVRCAGHARDGLRTGALAGRRRARGRDGTRSARRSGRARVARTRFRVS